MRSCKLLPVSWIYISNIWLIHRNWWKKLLEMIFENVIHEQQVSIKLFRLILCLQSLFCNQLLFIINIVEWNTHYFMHQQGSNTGGKWNSLFVCFISEWINRVLFFLNDTYSRSIFCRFSFFLFLFFFTCLQLHYVNTPYKWQVHPRITNMSNSE